MWRLMSSVGEAVKILIEGRNLADAQARAAMTALMSGEATQAEIGAFLACLRMKGETDEEVAAFVSVMRDNAVRIPCRSTDVVDTCGTGGDAADTFNISTAAAFVAAGAGVRVAKHGNRAVSSQCGSADVLKALGVIVEAPVETVADCIDSVGIGFLFAPLLHPAMKHAIGPRRELGVRTVFNLLGPLTNPAGARRQIVGVFAEAAVPLVAGALARLGCERALVVHGLCGLDEVSTVGPTVVGWVEGGTWRQVTWTPGTFGVPEATLDQLAGGDPEESARMLTDALEGAPGPRTDVVLVNAAGAVIAAGLADSPEEAMSVARESLGSGAARAKLDALREASRGGGAE